MATFDRKAYMDAYNERYRARNGQMRYFHRTRSVLDRVRNAVITGLHGLKEVPEHPGYFVSPAGRIFSNRGRGEYGRLVEMVGQITRGGYRSILLRSENQGMRKRKKQWMFAHALVLMAFEGPKPYPKAQARHLDGKRLNNRRENLRWGSPLENWQDRKKHGTGTEGEKHVDAILREKDIPSIRQRVSNGEQLSVLAREYGVSPSAICAVGKRRSWRHVP